MKKLTFIIIGLLLFACSKDSTEPAEEDNINLEILVKENKTPVPNIYVEVSALVKLIHLNQNSITGDVESVALTETQVDKEMTNTYGKVNFNYKNKSLPNRNGIIIEKVSLKKFSKEILADSTEKFIEKGGSLNLSYNIGE